MRLYSKTNFHAFKNFRKLLLNGRSFFIENCIGSSAVNTISLLLLILEMYTAMPKVKLIDIAHGRSGDKGDGSNVGVIARHPDVYPFLKEHLTEDVVKEHMKHICKGAVERYELPNIGALNFVLHESLGGGGTVSLKLDAQGKTHASMLLKMEMEVPEDLLAKVKS